MTENFLPAVCEVFRKVSLKFLLNDLFCSFDPILIPILLFEVLEFMFWMQY